MVRPNTHGSTIEPTPTTPTRRWVWFAALALVLIAALHARLGPEVALPLGHDECDTVRAYGSIPYDVYLPDYRGTGRFDIRLLARGIGKCFVNDWDPANHYTSSLATSVAIFLFGASETSFRLPSLCAGVLVCLLFAIWGKHRSDSSVWGFVLGLAAAYHPYLVSYSLSCRGYVWTVLLVLAQIIIMDWLREHGAKLSPWTSLALTCLGALIFLNLISTAIMWLVPLYAVATWWWQPIPESSKGIPAKLRHIWQGTAYQPWLIQGIQVMLVVLLFILLKLPDLLEAQGKYGIPWSHSPVQLVGHLQTLRSLFAPGLWLGLLLAAAIGLVLALTKRGWHWLGLVVLASGCLTLLYSVAGRKFLYPRTYGTLLPAAFLLATHVWHTSSNWNSRVRQASRMVLFLFVCAGIAQGAWHAVRTPYAYRRHHLAQTPFYNGAADQTEKAFQALPKTQREHTVLALPYAWGGEMRSYLDEAKKALENTPRPDQPFGLAVFSQRFGNVDLVRLRPLDRRHHENVFWPVPSAFSQAGAIASTPPISCLLLTASPATENGPYLLHWQAEDSQTDAWKALLPLMLKDPLLAELNPPLDHPIADSPTPTNYQAAGVLGDAGRPKSEILALAWDKAHCDALADLLRQLGTAHGGTMQVWTLGVSGTD